jgi:hypothetical protein
MDSFLTEKIVTGRSINNWCLEDNLQQLVLAKSMTCDDLVQGRDDILTAMILCHYQNAGNLHSLLS